MKSVDVVANLRNERYVSALLPRMREAWEILGQKPEELVVPLGKMVDEMDRNGIERAFLVASKGDAWEAPYDDIVKVVKEYPAKFSGIVGFNPFEGMKGVKAVERAITEDGFVGAHVYPHWFGRPPNDAIYYPFYAKCSELGVPVQMQVGHATPGTYLTSVARPITLEDIAAYFRDLTIVGIHIGYPWTEEMISVAYRFPNVYIATDAHAPKYWEKTFVEYINGRGRKKVLFGTDYPVVGYDRATKEIDALPLKEEVRPLLMRENALDIYKMR